MQRPDVVHADLELVVWIIVVVVTMVSQMIKAAKQRPRMGPPVQSPGGGRPPPPPRRPSAPVPSADPQQELEDFLRSLTGQPPRDVATPESAYEDEVEEVAAPQPPPAPARPAPPPPAPRRVVPLPVDEGRVVVLRQEPTPEPPPRRNESASMAARRASAAEIGSYEVIDLTPGEDVVERIRGSLLHDLRTVSSMHKAIVLRELLSQPVALRRQGSDAIPGLS